MIPGRNDEISWSKMAKSNLHYYYYYSAKVTSSFAVNGFVVFCKIGFICKHYVTFSTFMIIQMLLAE